jgi:retron-type reverse transcriptase
MNLRHAAAACGSPNKAGQLAAEAMEERGSAKGNPPLQNAPWIQSWEGAPSALERVCLAAARDRRMRFTALLHHIYDLHTLRTAYLALKREAAAGVDGETWWHYSERLKETSTSLPRGLSGERTWPSRCGGCTSPRPTGDSGPLGVTALEDKIVQRATVEVLNAIYETDFLGLSYGFRPGRSSTMGWMCSTPDC